MNYKDRIKRVRLAKAIIKSDLFSETAITEMCIWLGFNDTAFRDRSSKNKLKDFLLDEKYWKGRK